MRRLLPVLLLLLCPLAVSGQDEGPDSKPKWSASFSGSGYTDPCVVRAGVKVCPTLDMSFDQVVAAQVAPDVGPVGFVFDVGGTPVKVPDGTYPNGFDGASGNAWDMQGGYLHRAHADGGSVFHPNTAFSACVVVTPTSAIVTNTSILGKYNSAGNQREWMLYATGADAATVGALFSDNGTTDAGHVTTLTRTLGLRPYMTSVICVTWRNAGDGTSPASLYVNRLAVAGTAGAQAPIYASTAPASVGAQAVGVWPFPGWIHRVTFWQDVELTAAEVLKYQAGFFGYLDDNGNITPTYYTGVGADIPPSTPFAKADTVIEPFMGMPGQGFSRVGELTEGVGGIPWTVALENKVWNPSAEFCADVAGQLLPVGWDVYATNVGCASTHRAHGSLALRAEVAADPDTFYAYLPCMTLAAATDYMFDMRSLAEYADTPGEVASIPVYIDYYSGADCASGFISSAPVVTAQPTVGAGWAWTYEGFTTPALTAHAQLSIVVETQPAQTFDIDAVQVWAGAYPVYAFCGHANQAVSTCAQIAPGIEPNPLRVSAAGISLKVIQPYSISEITGTGWYVLYSRSTGATNNLPNIQLDTSGPYIRSTVHPGTDGATNSCRNFGDAWLKDVQHEIHFSYSSDVGGDGYIWHEVDGTDYNAFTCSGPRADRAILNAIGTQLCIGHPYGYSKGSGFVQDLKVFPYVLP